MPVILPVAFGVLGLYVLSMGWWFGFVSSGLYFRGVFLAGLLTAAALPVILRDTAP